eukprot:scaffold12169_cov116-Isochrysis_galbana.AAC.4
MAGGGAMAGGAKYGVATGGECRDTRLVSSGVGYADLGTLGVAWGSTTGARGGEDRGVDLSLLSLDEPPTGIPTSEAGRPGAPSGEWACGRCNLLNRGRACAGCGALASAPAPPTHPSAPQPTSAAPQSHRGTVAHCPPYPPVGGPYPPVGGPYPAVGGVLPPRNRPPRAAPAAQEGPGSFWSSFPSAQ